MKTLYLEDLKELNKKSLTDHIVDSYNVNKSELKKYDFLIAYESVGSWGCDSSSWFLMRNKEDNKLYETHGSHCSCYGFEDQFKPEETTLDYLKSDKFYLCCGGYDDNADFNKSLINDYISKLK